LKNLGNFSNRCLKFLSTQFEGVVPAYEGEKTEYDIAFIKSLYVKFEEFLELLEEVKIKDALRATMAASSLCNTYVQEAEPWKLAKNNELKRCAQVVNTVVQALNLVAAMAEPFMPSFSAKVYEQLNLTRTEVHDKLYEHLKGHPERIETLIPAGHKIGVPAPIFREIFNEEMEEWKKRFGGIKKGA